LTATAGLLVQDEEELDRLAIALRQGGPRFAIVVCAEALRSFAEERLRARTPSLVWSDRIDLDTPESTLERLTRVASESNDAPIANLAVSDARVIQTLNWHREKLHRGAPVLLWMDGAIQHTFRALATDAWSFRATVAWVYGCPEPPHDHAPALEGRYRRLFAGRRASVASVYQALDRANELAAFGFIEAALAVAGEARARLDASPEETGTAKGELLEFTALACESVGRFVLARELYDHARDALREVTEPRAELLRRCVEVRRVFDPAAVGLHALDDLLARAREESPFLVIRDDAVHLAREAALTGLLRRGDVPAARAVDDELRAEGERVRDRMTHLDALARAREIAAREGALMSATGAAQRALTTTFTHDLIEFSVTPAQALALHLFERAELAAAERWIDHIQHTAATFDPVRPDRPVNAARPLLAPEWWHEPFELLRAHVQSARARPEEAITTSTRSLDRMRSSGRDAHVYHACVTLKQVAIDAQNAGMIDAVALARCLHHVEVAEDELRASTPDPRWYAALFPSLRAEFLACLPGRAVEAIALQREALSRAREVYPDFAPTAARLLAHHLLDADAPAEALAEATGALDLAVRLRRPEDLARLHAIRVLSLLARGAAEALVTPALDAMNAALDTCDSPRIRGETWLEFASCVPPHFECPDPLLLLTEARSIFADAPMPAALSRCEEQMGRILMARGRLTEARRYVSSALRRCERYGLALRVPLLKTLLGRVQDGPV
jgi:hypothetical protein